jgi:type VI secretion system protein ImpH
VHGASGTLPRHYTELIRRMERERRDPERQALRDWFDLFNQRFIALFYKAWEKYRFWLAAERGVWTGTEPDTFTRCLLSLIGLGTGGMRNRFQIRSRVGDERPRVLAEVRDLALLRYGGLLAQRKRNVLGLEQMLSDFLGHPVQVLQFQGRWLSLSEECQTQLGTSLQTCELGASALIGDQVWDVESKVRIRLGPLNYAEFLEFWPDTSPAIQGKAVFLLSQLTRFYVGPNLDWDVQMIVKGGQVPDCQLTTNAPGPRLGWNTWLEPDPRQGNAEEATFTAEECSWPGEWGLPVPCRPS